MREPGPSTAFQFRKHATRHYPTGPAKPHKRRGLPPSRDLAPPASLAWQVTWDQPFSANLFRGRANCARVTEAPPAPSPRLGWPTRLPPAPASHSHCHCQEVDQNKRLPSPCHPLRKATLESATYATHIPNTDPGTLRRAQSHSQDQDTPPSRCLRISARPPPLAMARMLVALVAVLALSQLAAPVSATEKEFNKLVAYLSRQHPTLVKLLMDNSESNGCPLV